MNIIFYRHLNLELEKYFDSIEFTHILRAKNKRADQLSNIAVDKYLQDIGTDSYIYDDNDDSSNTS